MFIYLLKRLFRLIFNRTVLILLGLLALCGFVWYAGPLFAFADYRPLASESVRWTIISGIICLFVLWLLIKLWRHYNVNARLVSGIGKITSSTKTDEKPEPGASEIKELQGRFAEAMTSLKSLRISKEGLSRFTGRYVYELPWYIIIGAPGSGKTTALVNSGLNFPLEEKIGRAALQGVSGTRNCDWWITDEAVLIDTAGRYTTQENEGIDKAEWRGFLGLLKKYRPRQPINGVLLTLSISDLLEADHAKREAHYATLKTRLAELQENFGIELPVYLWVTKTDLLAGFKEFFDNYAAEPRKQVWGFTFPYQKRNRKVTDSLDDEWQKLQERLFALQDGQLARETELPRLSAMYSLPQELAGLQDLLREAIEAVFRQSTQIARPLLRGVYFSSGTQDGTAFDRILSTLRRNISGSPEPKDAKNARNRALIKGKSYFLHNLFTQLIFQESHLAGRNTRWERVSKWLTWTGYAVSVLALIGAIAAWMVSYRNNQAYLVRVGENATALSDAVSSHPPESVDLLNMIGMLDSTTNLGDMPTFKRDGPPLPYRYGLYQGGKVGVATNVIYDQILKNGLLPIIAKRLDVQVRQPPVDNLEYLYEALKAYLMLHDVDHYDPIYLQQWVLADARRYLLPDADTATLDQLGTHLAVLFAKDHVVTSPFPMDDALVAQARDKLATFTTAQRVYLRLRARLEKEDLPEFNLLDVAGPQAANVFLRRSKLPLNRGIPGLFTYQGYWDVFDKQVNKATAEMVDDEGWVLGLASKTAKTRLDELAQGKLANEVRMAYLRDYVNNWEQYMSDIQLMPSDSLQTSIQHLRVLSAPDSPLPLFLRAVVKETTLLRENRGGDQTSLLDRATRRVRNTKNDIERIVGPVSPLPVNQKLERIVDDHFEPLRRLVGAPGTQTQSAPITATLKMLDDYYGMLVAADASIRSGGSPPPQDAAVRLRAEAARLPQPVRGMVDQVASSSSAQTNSLVRASLGANLNSTVGDFCRRAVAGRYPLRRSASMDVIPEDFAQLFAPGGMMDDFFNKNLASLVDISTWTFKKNIDGSWAGGGNGSLAAFQKAAVIRDVFFRGGGRTPSLRLEIKPLEMDPSIANMSLDVDGTVVRYSHGPQIAQSVPWPGPAGRNLVLLQISGTGIGNPGLQTDGPWALHRFFDKLTISSAGPNPAKFIATANIENKKIVFEVTANSVQNPFRLRQLEEFSCPSQF
ncbi:MAG: type VI secretion system membrane subunit TssM [Gallionellaceae bacterium]|jgi:type VI secretion system protein ImpL|nr:type VI secretion system membrane subunit TssM [Gallionellaceae bacterium]